MPAKTKKQLKFMQAVANSPKFAKKVGVPQSVGKEMVSKTKRIPKKSTGGTVDRIGRAVMPSRRDPDIDRMIKEVKVPTKRRK